MRLVYDHKANAAGLRKLGSVIAQEFRRGQHDVAFACRQRLIDGAAFLGRAFPRQDTGGYAKPRQCVIQVKRLVGDERAQGEYEQTDCMVT